MEPDMNDGGPLAALEEYTSDSKGEYDYWCDELEASEKTAQALAQTSRPCSASIY